MATDEAAVAQANTLGLGSLFDTLDQACRVTLPDAAEAFESDPDALLYLYLRVKGIITDLKDALDVLEEAAIDAMPTKELVVDGLGTFSYHTKADRKRYDHAAIESAVRRALIASPSLYVDEQAEILHHERIVDNTITAVFEVRGTSGWKSNAKEHTGLAGLDIDRDEYCEVEFGRKAIKVIAATDPRLVD